MDRPITKFHQDDLGDWVAELSCGHGRHVRHNPPFVERAWVTTVLGRSGRIGTTLDCVRCDRFEMPEGFTPYKRTREFTESSVPGGFLKKHSTKAGVWAQIHVLSGQLSYHMHSPFHRELLVQPGGPVVILPEIEHHVNVNVPVSFFVEFWKESESAV